MLNHDHPDTPPARRRIVPQPLRTEAPLALITSNTTTTGELEERLRRGHVLITFPSFAHFLAEPPRREPWAAIVVARTGAWDPRLDEYVRRRRCIALYGLTEEGYGWPETVARVGNLSEIDAWLESLNAPDPEPVRKIRRVKRETPARSAAPASPVPTSATESSAAQASTTEPSPAAPKPSAAPAAQESTAAAPAKPTLPPGKGVLQLALPGLIEPRVERKSRSTAPRRTRSASRPRRKAQVVTKPRRVRADEAPASHLQADRDFTRLAAELGLVRASALLVELRQRAKRTR